MTKIMWSRRNVGFIYCLKPIHSIFSAVLVGDIFVLVYNCPSIILGFWPSRYMRIYKFRLDAMRM